MQFKDEKELYDFYAKYAYDVGFPIRKRSSTKDEDGVLRYVTLTCSREGRKSGNSSTCTKPRPTTQTGCKARISASFDIYGYWKINAMYLDHNHKTSLTKSRLYRCNREIGAHVKRKLEVNDMAGIPLHKSFNSAVVEARGYKNMTCIEKDCRNYVEKVRRLRLGEGDAAAIQSYFCKMQATCIGFYFSIDVDNDSRLKDMYFVQDMASLHAWSSTHGILTDQDRAMQNAIEIVFPNTKHRWCLWYIMKKFPEKFGNHVDKSSIFAAIHVLVYDSQFVKEFEDGWKLMIDTYDLHNHDWLPGLYDNRSRWVSCYN